MEFDPKVARGYAEKIARPRLVGTTGEAETAQEIESCFARFGYQVDRQDFQFNDALNSAIKFEIILGQLLIILTFISQGFFPSLAGGIAILILVLLGLIPRINRRLMTASIVRDYLTTPPLADRIARRVGGRYSTTNLIARHLSEDPRTGMPHLILSAHYDSKSQSFSLLLRVAFFSLLIFGAVLFSVLAIIGLFGIETHRIGVWIGALAVFSGIPLLLLQVGNNSAGAIDNASGVGLLLHLAEVLAEADSIHRDLDLTFLVTGAEEMGLMGANAYMQETLERLKGQARGRGLMVLNFDGIGGKGFLNIVGGSSSNPGSAVPEGTRATQLLRKCCAESGIQVRSVNLPGLMLDHMPFANADLDAVSLVVVGKSARRVHTPEDTIARLYERSFKQVGQVTLCLIDELLKESGRATPKSL
jgi:Peptidase family M28